MKLGILLILSLLLPVCLAETQNMPGEMSITKIAAGSINGMIQQDLEGRYDRIIKALNLNITYDVLPPKRASQNFIRQNYDCIFPGNLGFMEIDNLITTTHINKASVYIFTKISNKLLTLNQLKGIEVIAINGITYPQSVHDAGIQLVKTRTEEGAIKMLLGERYHYMLGYMPDLVPYQDEYIEGNIVYDKDNPIETIFDNIACHPNKMNKTFIKAFNQNLNEIKNTGALKAILGPWLVE